jgi:hypothetical protein
MRNGATSETCTNPRRLCRGRCAQTRQSPSARHLAFVHFARLVLFNERLDHLFCLLRSAALAGDKDRAVVFDSDVIQPGYVFDAVDSLAAAADDEANLVGRTFIVIFRCARANVWRAVRRFLFQSHPVFAARATFAPCERLNKNRHRDAVELDVELYRGDAVFGARNFKVHAAKLVFGALDVGEHFIFAVVSHEAHRNAGNRRLDRHAAVHEREC